MTGAADDPAPSSGPKRWDPAVRWLAFAVVAYFVVSFALSWLRSLEFQTTTWDQGLYQQALWTTAHGRAFYETADVETGGLGSLLDVHSVFLLYPVALLYGVLPYPTTLFAVQSAVVAAAAVPLFLLGRDVTGSSRLGLLSAVVYLAWTPTLSSNLYDFHPESFLPLEIFALVLLWNRQRFAPGLAVAAISFLTIELAPVLVFFVGVFALAGVLAAAPLARILRPRAWPAILRAGWLRRDVRATLALMAASVIAYAALLWLRVDVFPAAFGTVALPTAASGYVIGATPAALGLSWANLGVGFGTKVTYWIVIVGLLAFVPLLSPRSLLLAVPWFGFTLFSSNVNYVTLGFQYGFIAGSALLVAFVFGLERARRWGARLAARSPSDAVPAGPVGGRRRRSAGVAVAAAVAVLIAINVALSPVNPAMQNSGLGSGYRLSYDPAPGAAAVDSLARVVPARAVVLASDDLFPLVANDPNAYSFLWTTDPGLAFPFGVADPPAYVLLSEDRTYAVTPWVTDLLYQSSVYGVRGVVWSSPVGSVLLFEAGFRGPTQVFGPAADPGGAYFGSTLAAYAGLVESPAPGSTYGSAVASVPGLAGEVWAGPDLTLPSGNYTVTVSVRAAVDPGFAAPNGSAPTLWIGVYAFAQPSFYGVTYSFGQLDSVGFTSIEIPIELGSPTIEFSVQGETLASGVGATLNYVSIDPSTSAMGGGS